MAYEIFIDEDLQYITIVNHGAFTNQLAMAQNIESHELGRQKGINRYLVDLTNSHFAGSIVDHYQFAYEELPKEAAIDLLAKVALLVSPQDHSHDFMETVARNSGINLTIFRDRELAIRHLISDSFE
jgi:hypothetical protein